MAKTRLMGFRSLTTDDFLLLSWKPYILVQLFTLLWGKCNGLGNHLFLHGNNRCTVDDNNYENNPIHKNNFFFQYLRTLSFFVLYLLVLLVLMHLFYVTYHKSSIIKTLPHSSHISPFFQARKVTKHHPSFLIPHNQINKTVWIFWNVITPVTLLVDSFSVVYSHAESLNLCLIFGCMTSKFMCLNFSTLHSSSLWRIIDTLC